MRRGISFTVSAGDGQRLRAIVADPKSPQKHVWRARIVLLSGAGLGTSAIMGETDKSKTCVWRWQERFMHEGVGGLLRDKSRPPGKAPIAPDRVAWIVRQTQQPPPHEATHWTLRAMAKAAGVAASTVQAIWKAHGLSPHRWRNFKRVTLRKPVALERPGLRREARRYRRLVCRSTGPCGGAVDRREVADPSTRPHPARPADEEGPHRHHDP